jgi:hypothetical protein
MSIGGGKILSGDSYVNLQLVEIGLHKNVLVQLSK